MDKKNLIISLVFLLTACAMQVTVPVIAPDVDSSLPPDSEENATASDDEITILGNQEAGFSQSSSSESFGSEAAASADTEEIIKARLLPTGILDIGNTEAPVTILIFTEHHSRYGREFQLEYFPRLYKDFIKTGRLRLQTVVYPLQKYINSETGAAALFCAAVQNQGWEMHESLFLSQQTDLQTVMQIVSNNNEIDGQSFSECMDSEQTKNLLAQQKSLARSLTVFLVPVFYINGERMVGLPDYAQLRGEIETLIEG